MDLNAEFYTTTTPLEVILLTGGPAIVVFAQLSFWVLTTTKVLNNAASIQGIKKVLTVLSFLSSLAAVIGLALFLDSSALSIMLGLILALIIVAMVIAIAAVRIHRDAKPTSAPVPENPKG